MNGNRSRLVKTVIVFLTLEKAVDRKPHIDVHLMAPKFLYLQARFQHYSEVPE